MKLLGAGVCFVFSCSPKTLPAQKVQISSCAGFEWRPALLFREVRKLEVFDGKTIIAHIRAFP